MNFSWIMKCLCSGILISSMALHAAAQAPLQDRLTGDMGAAVYSTQKIVRDNGAKTFALPYAYFDHGRFYTRVDTVGVKTAPLGRGYLELAGRISFEGFKNAGPGLHGIDARANPLPLGLGTYQETPWGAVFAYGFYDTVSGGMMQELTYAAELNWGSLVIYPQLGVEHRSQKYVQHLYGVSPRESVRSGLDAYSTSSSTTPILAMAFEWPLDDAWHINVQLRRRWLDTAISQSPLVFTHVQDSGFMALTRSFK
jgi:outer membrane protein